MKKVLLAIGNDKFNSLLRTPLSTEFQVLTEEVYSRKYLEEFIEDYQPDIIVVHDYFLASEKLSDFDKEVEWLQIIERIRHQYDDQKRIVFVCERLPGDPFLSELINRNVLDIFHSRTIDIKGIIEQLKDQPRYSKVAYLKVEDSGQRYNAVKHTLFNLNLPITDEKSSVESIEDIENNKEDVVIDTSNQEITKAEKKKAFNFPKFSFGSKKKDIDEIVIPQNNDLEEELEVEVEVEVESKEDVQPPRRVPLNKSKELEFNEPEIIEEDEPEIIKENELEESHKIQEDVKSKKKFSLFGNKTTEEPNFYASFKPRLIAVGSIHPGAGSTFFLHNFTRYLSDNNVPTAILEGLNGMDALFTLAAEEDKPSYDWESSHNIIMQQHRQYMYSIPRWTLEGTIVIPTLEVNESNFTDAHAKELLYFARQTPIVFVDISHDWEDPISKEAIAMCDELWCITEPNPMYLEIQRKHHQAIFQVSNRIGEQNVIVIGNKWGIGVDISRFPQLAARIPYVPENIKALSSRQPAYRLKPKSFIDFDKLYKRLI